jgi:AcrR family transcriptional regulator
MTLAAFTLTDLLADDADPDAEHERILDAALAAFMDFGIRRTSMGEVARRASISPATLYRRFSGKEHIVWAVGRREVQRLIALVDAQVDPAESAEDQVVAMAVAFLGGLRENALLHRLLTTEPEIVLPLLTTQGAVVLALGRAYVVEFIRRVQRHDDHPTFDPDPVAEMVARVALSLALTPQTCLPVDDEAAFRQFAHRHIAGALGLAPASATA